MTERTPRWGLTVPLHGHSLPEQREVISELADLGYTAATLAELAPGRFVLGVGTSTPVVVQQWNDIPFEAPYQRSRDTLRFLRAALAGEKGTEQYETFRVSGFRLR